MRILLATPYLHPDGGGLERYADALAARFHAEGHEVTQVGFADAPRYEYERGWRRVSVRPATRVSNTPVGLAVRDAVRKLLAERRFDVVNGHSPVPGAAESAASAARRAGVPFVATYHAGRLSGGGLALGAVAALHRATFERAMLRRAAACIAVSDYVRDHALAQRDAVVVPPGVDVARFREVAPAVPGRILFVGPVSKAYAWKGLSTLFDAFERIAARDERAHLRVVGAGDLVDHYRRRAEDAGLARRVELAGRARDEDLPREYSRASVVVLPSVTDAESFGMVLAEANACGRPVVGSRIGGIPCFVRDGENGLLAPPRDAASLADAIARVLSDETLARRLGETGAALVRDEHRWEDLAARTLAVYEEAAAKRPASAATLATKRALAE